MLTTPDKVREYIGLTSSDAPDNLLEQYIARAQREFLNDVAVYVRDDTLTGNIDGVNSTFWLTYPHVADRNFDGEVDEEDIKVYKWGKAGSLDLRETVTVASFDPVYGKVVLSEAPASTYDVVTATYYYYPREIDENLIPEAVACLAAFYYVMREFLLIPERLSHGAYRFSHARPYMVLLDQYYRIRDIMLGKIHTKGEHGEPSLIRTELK